MSGIATPTVTERPFEMADDPLEYCRAIETYLCRKNDGHLMRVVGPAFEVVSAWQRDGVPFKVACEGIDRYVERYYRKGPRRRPVRIEFCDADVRDVFDEWRRATGAVNAHASGADAPDSAARRGPSLPEHIERALIRLTSARATGRLSDAADTIVDELSAALDEARRAPGGLRGEKREAMLEHLQALDSRLAEHAAASVDANTLQEVGAQALDELAAFRADMPRERFERAQRLAVDRLLRQRLTLPTLKFS